MNERHAELDQTELQAVVARAVALDPDAWEDLYRHCYRKLHSYARRRLPSDDAAEDAVSETIARALGRIDTFTWTDNGFDAWMYGIARNVVLETQRGVTRSRKLWDRGNNEVQAARPASHTDLSDVFAEHHDRTVVLEAFGQLSADDQEILELRVVGQMGAEAVGDVVGKKAGAVRMAQSRAVDRLRAAVEEIDHG